MEINQINNSKLKMAIADNVVIFLLNNQLIEKEEVQNIQVQFGYIFSKPDGVLEGLLKVQSKEKTYYFAIQNNSIQLIAINEQLYNNTINDMKKYHECLNEITPHETETQRERRQKNNQYLSKNNISTNENLFCRVDDSSVSLKSIDDICKRAIACLITTQIACDINKGNYKQSVEFFLPIYKMYGVENDLNSKEKRIIDGTYDVQDAIDIEWAYESYWALCWCLGLVDNINDAGRICDCNQAIMFVTSCKSYDEFKSRCNLRSVKEILDINDLYYRYNWAINNKKIDTNTNIGNIIPSNVLERLRGLEWIISREEDWYNISLDA